jgi:hypothetical protein
MKYVKMASIAMAAMLLTALLGAGSASATVLCKKYQLECLEPWGLIEITASLKSKTSVEVKDIHGTLLNTCTGSTIKSETENAGGNEGEPVTGVNEAETFTGCTHTMTVLEKGNFEVRYLGPTTRGTLLFSNDNVTVEEFGVTCSYGSGVEDEVGMLEADESTSYGEADIVEAEFTKVAGSFLCPPVVFWSGEYLITEPGKNEIYIKNKNK